MLTTEKEIIAMAAEALMGLKRVPIHHLEQEKITSLFGSVDYDPGFNYKKQRERT